jgi:hypothetical protein
VLYSRDLELSTLRPSLSTLVEREGHVASVMMGVKGDSKSLRKACKAFVLRIQSFEIGNEAQKGTGDSS